MDGGAPTNEDRIPGHARVLAGCLLAAFGWNLLADDARTDFKVDQFRWREPVSQPLMVIVDNPYGNVRSRSWARDELSVTGQLQRVPEDPPLNVQVEVQRQTVRVTVTDPAEGKDMTGRVRRADLVILAPTGLNMSVQTQSGEIHFKKYVGDVTARSVDGSISLRTNGAVDAVTGAGSITAKLDARWEGQVALETDSGAMKIFMPEHTNTHIDAQSTTGKVESELSPELLHDVKSEHHLFSATLGSGVQKLQARSKSGDIHIRKKP